MIIIYISFQHMLCTNQYVYAVGTEEAYGQGTDEADHVSRVVKGVGHGEDTCP